MKLPGPIPPCGSMHRTLSSTILGTHPMTPRNHRTPTHIHQENMNVGFWHVATFVLVTDSGPGRSGPLQWLDEQLGLVAKQTLAGATKNRKQTLSIRFPINIRCLTRAPLIAQKSLEMTYLCLTINPARAAVGPSPA